MSTAAVVHAASIPCALGAAWCGPHTSRSRLFTTTPSPSTCDLLLWVHPMKCLWHLSCEGEYMLVSQPCVLASILNAPSVWCLTALLVVCLYMCIGRRDHV